MKPAHDIYGVIAEFESAQALLDAAQAARRKGFTKIEAYSPFPVEGLAEAVGFKFTVLPMIILGGGITGALSGFGMQYFANVIHYPLIIGGKPLNSWPAFIPITFELTILFAALSAVVGMIVLNGLPQPYHPLFNVDRFALVSRDRFFLCIESEDPQFDSSAAREFMQTLAPVEVTDVPW
jgi:hypothetical protein